MYADIIVDISHENLDKTYQYAVPEELSQQAKLGVLVEIPFGRGNRVIKGYIVSFSDIPKFDPNCIKNILRVVENSLVIESHLIQLASWIKENYGATMNDALKTVIPIKKSVKKKEKKQVELLLSHQEAVSVLEELERKKYKAQCRLLEELISENIIRYDMVVNKLNISRATVLAMEEKGILKVTSETVYRNPVKAVEQTKYTLKLNEEQERIALDFISEYKSGKRGTYLIHGITGSGKTEVYMEMIDAVIQDGKQVIMLIPEIALTYQTVMRFYKRFGDRISIMNSRLSAGERYDQYVRAKNGEIDIMIGSRSALFTPFDHLGLIIIDEEHESSYKSEMPPKYHARETAVKRAELVGASVVLGSATPSLEAYKRAMDGEYKLYTMTNRAGKGNLPDIWISDLREELKKKNKSIFSHKLKELILDRLSKKQQIMLFINRRGYAGFVSCRSCGYVMKCSHCDVSLTYHNKGALVCHYCGTNEVMPDVCPSCGSRYIATFGTGTQKVEDFARKEFPGARILRMDTDTTSGKDGHEHILSAFSNQEADILVGTQMIVKGHDFPNVTLVGILAADLSLYANDYRASERTFQLLAQASGRAGRGEGKGEVVIQTYNPEHYSILAAKDNDYEEFYRQEIGYRTLMKYPPVSNILAVLIASKKEDKAETAGILLGNALREEILKTKMNKTEYDNETEELVIIGPAKASIGKVNDIYRRIIYVKHEEYGVLRNVKDFFEAFIDSVDSFKECNIQFDFNPLSNS